MLFQYRTFRDEEYGLAGLAIQVECQLTRERLWLWTDDDLQGTHEPFVSSYILNSVAELQKMSIPSILARLQRAGVLSISQYCELQHVFAREVDYVLQYWRNRNQPVPSPFLGGGHD